MIWSQLTLGNVFKFHDADGCAYPPIGELVKLAGLNVAYGDSSISTQSKKPPPHALLPEDIADEIPVHGATDRFVSCLCLYIITV